MNSKNSEARQNGLSRGLKVRTNVKAGGLSTSPSMTPITTVAVPVVTVAIISGLTMNHNESLARASRGLKVRTNVKAGGLSTSPSMTPITTVAVPVVTVAIISGLTMNHNESLARASRGLKVRTNVKAGGLSTSPSMTPITTVAVPVVTVAIISGLYKNHNEALLRTSRGLKVRANAI